MASIPSAQTMTVTTNGQVIIFVPQIKTEQVTGPIATSSPAIPRATSSHVASFASSSGTHVVVSSSTLIVSTKRSSGHPTTFITSVRSTTHKSQSVLTEVITSTATLPSPTPTDETTTSVAFTRASEDPLPNAPFGVPLATSQTASPLETGGVHTPQPEFNGLAASPGVIIGTFAAVIGFGVLCFLACWCRRKRIERNMMRAGHGHAARAQRQPRAVIPSLNIVRKINSPVWFGRRRKNSSTELKHLPSESNRSAGTGVPSVDTPSEPQFPQNPQSQALVLADDVRRHSVLSEIEETHRDLDGDILRTGSVNRNTGTFHYRSPYAVTEKGEDLEMGYIAPEKGIVEQGYEHGYEPGYEQAQGYGQAQGYEQHYDNGYEKSYNSDEEDVIGLAISHPEPQQPQPLALPQPHPLSQPEPLSQPQPPLSQLEQRRGIPMDILMEHLDEHESEEHHRLHGKHGSCVVCELEDTSERLNPSDYERYNTFIHAR
ncbi:hypothetical protein ABW21_db0208313 [Orbilia brochopaga]|nr:hypothetical protein ABW21_db0208313 [Drechslerella brochopaga]